VFLPQDKSKLKLEVYKLTTGKGTSLALPSNSKGVVVSSIDPFKLKREEISIDEN